MSHSIAIIPQDAQKPRHETACIDQDVVAPSVRHSERHETFEQGQTSCGTGVHRSVDDPQETLETTSRHVGFKDPSMKTLLF